MLISLLTPSLGGVSQRNQYHGAILTSGYIHSVQGSHFWSLLATSYASFVTASCLAAYSGRGPLCSSLYLPMLDGELSQLWRGSNLGSSDHRARTRPTTPPHPVNQVGRTCHIIFVCLRLIGDIVGHGHAWSNQITIETETLQVYSNYDFT